MTVAQFDDTHLCLFVDPEVRARYDDPQREIDLAVDLLNQIVDGVAGVTVAVHLCRGNAGRLGWKGAGGYEYPRPGPAPPAAWISTSWSTPSRWRGTWPCCAPCPRTA